MHYVEPIRDISDINKIKEILINISGRDYLLFVLGINTGLRISDILRIKVSDIKSLKYLNIKEQKTKKSRKILLTNSIKFLLKNYLKNKSDEEYLFKSRKGVNQPISRVQAWRIINNACKSINIEEHIGTHTLRKTFGYHFYKKTKDVALLQNILNHSSPNVTLRYIGINQDIIDTYLQKFSL